MQVFKLIRLLQVATLALTCILFYQTIWEAKHELAEAEFDSGGGQWGSSDSDSEPTMIRVCNNIILPGATNWPQRKAADLERGQSCTTTFQKTIVIFKDMGINPTEFYSLR